MSQFGSHESMQCDPIEEDTILGVRRITAGEVLLKDAAGYYVTDFGRMDNGLSDPNRYGSERARNI